MSSLALLIIGLLSGSAFCFLLGWALCKAAARTDGDAEDRPYTPTEEGIRLAESLDRWSGR